jgi:hypothetical protein
MSVCWLGRVRVRVFPVTVHRTVVPRASRTRLTAVEQSASVDPSSERLIVVAVTMAEPTKLLHPSLPANLEPEIRRIAFQSVGGACIRNSAAVGPGSSATSVALAMLSYL